MASAGLTKGKTTVDIKQKDVSVGVEMHNGKGEFMFFCKEGIQQENAQVMKISFASCLLGHLFTNDIITSVNGNTKVQSTSDFYTAIKAAIPGKVTICYERDETCKIMVKDLPSTVPNVEVKEIDIVFRTGGAHLGLLIHKNIESQATVVAVVEDGGPVAKHIMAGDQLIKVNGKPVGDRDEARSLILDSINKYKKVNLVIERYTTKPFKFANSVMLSADATRSNDLMKSTVEICAKSPVNDTVSSDTERSFIPSMPAPLAADVMEIMQKNRQFYLQPCTTPSILINTPKSRKLAAMPMLSLGQKHEKTEIGYDPSPRELRKTPKRHGSA